MYFPPFAAEDFRQDVHWSTYRCIAGNTVGTIISRDVAVYGVVLQKYEPEVQNPSGFIGSNVLIKCNIPSFAKEYVTITSWLQEPNFNIYPSLEGDGKSHMLLSGELLVYNITRNDAKKIYRCRTHHKLTQDSVVSRNAGEIQLTEFRDRVPPIMNEKSSQFFTRLGDPVVVPCIAYANPKPTFRWFTKRSNEKYIQNILASGRAKIKDGTLIISAVEKTDNGAFYCIATNSEGTETFEAKILVTYPLASTIQPSIQTINIGQPADLICSVTGFPKHNIRWLKNGRTLGSGSRVRLITREHVRFSSIIKEDKGIYQCFIDNDIDSAQSSAELRLGGILFPPQHVQMCLLDGLCVLVCLWNSLKNGHVSEAGGEKNWRSIVN
ncbi:cell adhesion molecule Dscam1-like isoform X2 [Drosophila tropicalis]|uniref:cell adhesion molecule Dscam1-like isoform X2 n=1 Tax=Drosophila tropicalis TaxID=46794 RepID=UPI0035AB7F25